MITQTTQIKVTLPLQLQAYLRTKSDKFGLTMSSYLKTLIINDVKDVDYPIYQASDKLEKSYKQSLKERKKAIKIDNINTFFNSL